jgi:hypothetical protein
MHHAMRVMFTETCCKRAEGSGRSPMAESEAL